MEHDQNKQSVASSRMPFLSDIIIFTAVIVLLVGMASLITHAITSFPSNSSPASVASVPSSSTGGFVYVLAVISRIIGVVILLKWFFSLLPGQRRYVRMAGSIMKATVVQLNVLPFLTGLGLLVTGQVWIIPCAFFASRKTPDFFLYHMPVVCGGYYGYYLATHVGVSTWPWRIGGVVGGVVVIFILMNLITGFTGPRARE